MTRLILRTMLGLSCWFAPAHPVLAQYDEPADPLCRAALHGDVALTKDLLSRGVNPNAADAQGETPLMWAAWTMAHLADRDNQAGKPDYQAVASLLLDKGADSNARDHQGRTALLL